MPPKKAGKRKQRGGGIGDVISKLNKVAKDTKIMTSLLNTMAPDSGIAQTVSEMAGQLGYGRRRTSGSSQRRKQRGGSFADTFGNILGGIGGGIGRGVNQTLGGLFGGGRVQSYAVNPMMIR